MNLRPMHIRYCSLAFATWSACAGLWTVSVVSAAHAPTAASIQSQYEQDVQRCNSGQTHQSRAVCLQEAGAARAEARRKRLDDGQSANYNNNAVDRCNRLPQSQREDCLLQMRAPSAVRGSVEGGGILRETIIQVPVQAAPDTGSSGTVPGALPGGAPISPVPALSPPVAPVPLQR